MDMESFRQVGFLLIACFALIDAQGDELRGLGQMGRAAGPGPGPGPTNDRYYYMWMPPPHPHQYHHNLFPGMPNFRNFAPHPQQFVQNDPLYFRNFYNSNPLPYPPPLNPQFEVDRDPTVILLPPENVPTQRPTTESTTTTTARPEEAKSTEGQDESTTQVAVSQEELEESRELMRSATSGFTNAHHYPFPIGLWSQYKKSIGLESEPERQDEEQSSVNPRKFTNVLLLPHNQMPFISTQRHFPDWSYGRPHSGRQFPENLLRMPGSEAYDGRNVGAIGDSQYQYFAVPLRSVLNQMNSDVENERV